MRPPQASGATKSQHPSKKVVPLALVGKAADDHPLTKAEIVEFRRLLKIFRRIVSVHGCPIAHSIATE